MPNKNIKLFAAALPVAPERRYVQSVFRRVAATNPDGKPIFCELDSHADTCCAGANFVMLEEPYKHVNVYAYSGEYKPLTNIPVTVCATVWVSPVTGESYLLVVNEALYFGERLDSSLLCPNQLRDNGLTVDDVPKQYSADSTHSIYDPVTKVRIPLSLKGVISCFETHKPSPEEVLNLPQVTLTSALPWHPTSLSFAEAEAECLLRQQSRIASVATLRASDADTSTRTLSALRAYSNMMEDPLEMGGNNLYDIMVANVNATSDDIPGMGTSGSNDNKLYPDRHRNIQALSALSATDRKSVITPEILSKRWGISLPAATRTLRVTTQAGVRNVFVSSERKVRKKAPWLKFPSIKGKFYTDSMYSKVKSLHGDTGGSMFTNGHGFDLFYPWKKKSEHPEQLMAFIHDVGVPQVMISDGAPELTDGRTKEICQEYRIKQKHSVPYSAWQILAEASIREHKRNGRRILRRTNAPPRTWSYALKWSAAIRRLTALDIPQLDGRVAEENVKGSTPDISSYAMFDWYQLVWYYTPTAEFPHQKKTIGRWLGVAENCTDDLAYTILPKSCKVVVRKDVWAVTKDEMADPIIQAEIAEVDKLISDKLNGTSGEESEDFPLPDYNIFDDDDADMEPFEPEGLKPEADEYTPEAYDEYLSARVLIPRGGDPTHAIVRKRKKGPGRITYWVTRRKSAFGYPSVRG